MWFDLSKVHKCLTVRTTPNFSPKSYKFDTRLEIKRIQASKRCFWACSVLLMFYTEHLWFCSETSQILMKKKTQRDVQNCWKRGYSVQIRSGLKNFGTAYSLLLLDCRQWSLPYLDESHPWICYRDQPRNPGARISQQSLLLRSPRWKCLLEIDSLLYLLCWCYPDHWE